MDQRTRALRISLRERTDMSVVPVDDIYGRSGRAVWMSVLVLFQELDRRNEKNAAWLPIHAALGLPPCAHTYEKLSAASAQ